MTTWFPPLPGDQPNEPIIPIGQTEEETPEPVREELRHIFVPIVSVTRREDGRFNVTVDWSSAFDRTVGDGGRTVEEETGDYTEPHLESTQACAAVDAWTKRTSQTFIIDAPEEG